MNFGAPDSVIGPRSIIASQFIRPIIRRMFNFSEIRFLFPFRVEKVEGGSVDSIVVKKALRDVPVKH